MDYLLSKHNRRRVIQGVGGATAALAIGKPSQAQDAAVEINFWNWWDVGRQPLMDSIIDQFHTEFPNIVIKNVPQTWDRRDELVVTALSGGNPPQIIMASRQEIVKFADSGAIAPITQHVADMGIDLEGYYPSEIASMWWEDDLYALPMPTAGGETGLYFYNIDMLTEAGLDPDSPPETWDQLSDAIGKLTVLGDNGGIEVLGANIGVDMGSFLAMLYCNNGSLYSEDLKTVTFNSEEGVETLSWLLDVVNTHFGGQQNVLDWSATIQQGEDRFHQQRQPIQFQNVSQFFHLKNKVPDLKYGVHYRPYNSGNPDAASHGVAALTFGWGYVMPAGLDPEIEEAAFTFIKRITWDEEGACRFVFEQERPSPLVQCNENPEYLEVNASWDKVITSLENDISVGILPVQSQVMSTLTDYLEMVGFEEMSPEEGLGMAAEEAQGIVDEFWASST